jgi:capsular exopolysaccharide synthesis family protein
MSKIFEALQRLEKESGKLPPRVSTEAQRILQQETAAATPAPMEEWREAVDSLPIDNNGVAVESPPLEPAFDLAKVPVEEAVIAPSARVVYYSEPDSPAADRFRLLRMRLWPLWESGKLSSLVVTSAEPKDGKSTVSLNLATALAEQGKRRVLLVEGDLYRPSLTQRLGLADSAGLAECLEASLDPFSALRRVEPLGLFLLPAGQPQGNPTELLQSPLLPEVFKRLRTCFDWILVDTPPAIPLTDTLSFRDCVDACLLVVRADRTPVSAVEAAVARLGKQHVIGMLLNGSEEVDRLYSDYRMHYGVVPQSKNKR